MKNTVIYCVFVRNHGPNGTFADVQQDLPRIASMGVEYIWLLPIYPIGVTNRKGTLGSPYSISDYRGINSEHGTMEDFQKLLKETHALGMKLILDIVFNHTSYNHCYLEDHATWYNRDKQGNPVARVPDWTDIVDLRHNGSKFVKYNASETGAEASTELWDELVDVLKFWISLGVDGFRCDVAAFIPLHFWVTARKELVKIKPNTLWIAESYLISFMERSKRENAFKALPFVDVNDLHQAFDLTYDYETYTAWKSVLSGNTDVKSYLELLRMQSVFLSSAEKMRFVENHDKPRIMSLVKNQNEAITWTAFSAFNSGSFLIYGGQESEATKQPSLFESDKITWGFYSLQPLLTKLIAIKKSILPGSILTFLHHSPAIVACWESPQDNKGLLGIFNVRGEKGEVKLLMNNGTYKDAITNAPMEIKGGLIQVPETFQILCFTVGDLVPKQFQSFML